MVPDFRFLPFFHLPGNMNHFFFFFFFCTAAYFSTDISECYFPVHFQFLHIFVFVTGYLQENFLSWGMLMGGIMPKDVSSGTISNGPTGCFWGMYLPLTDSFHGLMS